jgi:hypothetical protein
MNPEPEAPTRNSVILMPVINLRNRFSTANQQPLTLALLSVNLDGIVRN